MKGTIRTTIGKVKKDEYELIINSKKLKVGSQIRHVEGKVIYEVLAIKDGYIQAKGNGKLKTKLGYKKHSNIMIDDKQLHKWYIIKK